METLELSNEKQKWCAEHPAILAEAYNSELGGYICFDSLKAKYALSSKETEYILHHLHLEEVGPATHKIIKLVCKGTSVQQILEDNPTFTEQQVRAVLDFKNIKGYLKQFFPSLFTKARKKA